jgi:hypothetical protein
MHGRPRFAMRILAVLLFSLASLFAAAVQGAEITATSLDGSKAAGSLKSWDDGQLVIVDSSGERAVATDRLLSARLAPAQPAKPVVVNGQTAELIDGTLFPIASLKVVGRKAMLEATQPNGNSPPIEIPITQIEAIRFRPMDAALATQWDEIRALNRVTDLLVVLKRDGQSLDYVEGVVGDISADKVAFKLDGESNAVDRAKVAGIIYYRADRAPQADSRVTLQGKSGLRARAAKIHLAGANVNLTTPSGIEFDWPIDDIELADFSAGKLMYLSDIEPASENWSPLISLPIGATLANEYGQPRRDRSAFGGLLSVTMKRDAAETGEPGSSRSFNKGLSLRSRTEIIYRLPPGFNRFSAIAGVDPAAASTGNLRLAIFADDRPLLETDLAGDQPALPIDVEITNAKRLKILVDFGQNLDTGDWLNLCDAKIIK